VAKPKKKPAQLWRLYLVVAVDPFWGGKQHRGRFYKFGITTEANVLDRHPSYTEELLSLRVGTYKGTGTHCESLIRGVLRSLGAIKGDEFSTEAVHCSAVTAEVLRVLVVATWASVGRGRFGFSEAIEYAFQARTENGLIEDQSDSIRSWATFANECSESDPWISRTLFWHQRFLGAANEWLSLPKPSNPEPMWA
jgi:hypothetical protein